MDTYEVKQLNGYTRFVTDLIIGYEDEGKLNFMQLTLNSDREDKLDINFNDKSNIIKYSLAVLKSSSANLIASLMLPSFINLLNE